MSRHRFLRVFAIHGQRTLRFSARSTIHAVI